MTPADSVVAHAHPTAEPNQQASHPPESDPAESHRQDSPLAVFHPNQTSVDAGFFTWEIASGQVICDAETYRMHGLPEDPSATIDTFLTAVPESDVPQFREAMRQVASATGTYQIEYRVHTADRGLRSMEARGRIVPGPDGRPARLMGVVMDTTAVRAGREEHERRLRALADRAGQTRDFTAALTSAITVSAIVDAAPLGLLAYGADSLIVVAARDGRVGVAATCGLDDATVSALSGLDSARPALTPISRAIQRNVPVYIRSPQQLAEAYPRLADVAGRSDQHAWAVIPVPDSAGRVGACLFGFPESREFPAEERAQLFAVSGLLAQSLERARMYENQRALATELQRGMLPRGELTAPGISIVTRYLSATSGIEIGGDFYDVVHFPDGRVALVIGDVEGHSLLAASLMGRLRTAVHAYAREGHGPAEVLARANQWLFDLNTEPDMALFATCCLVVVNPATGDATVCRAGHPPPLLAAPGVPPSVLECDPGLPLGVDASVTYSTAELRLRAGSLLLLATDGLLVSGSADERHLRCLLEAMNRDQAEDLETVADELLSGPQSPRHGDDVALLLARLDLGSHSIGR